MTTHDEDARSAEPELPGLDRDQQLPSGPDEIASARELAEAERAVAAGGGTPREREMVSRVGEHREAADRRDLWQQLNDTA